MTSGETDFFTNKGILKFIYFDDNDEIIIRSRYGWKKGKIKKTKNQILYIIKTNKMDIYTDENQYWFMLENYSIKKNVKNMKKGDIFETFNNEKIIIDEIVKTNSIFTSYTIKGQDCFTLGNGILLSSL